MDGGVAIGGISGKRTTMTVEGVLARERAVEEAKVAVEAAKGAVEDANVAVEDAKGAVEAAERDVEEAKSAVKAAERDVEEAKSAVKAAERDVEDPKSAVKAAERDVEDARRGVTAAGEKLKLLEIIWEDKAALFEGAKALRERAEETLNDKEALFEGAKALFEGAKGEVGQQLVDAVSQSMLKLSAVSSGGSKSASTGSSYSSRGSAATSYSLFEARDMTPVGKAEYLVIGLARGDESEVFSLPDEDTTLLTKSKVRELRDEARKVSTPLLALPKEGKKGESAENAESGKVQGVQATRADAQEKSNSGTTKLGKRKAEGPIQEGEKQRKRRKSAGTRADWLRETKHVHPVTNAFLSCALECVVVEEREKFALVTKDVSEDEDEGQGKVEGHIDAGGGGQVGRVDNDVSKGGGLYDERSQKKDGLPRLPDALVHRHRQSGGNRLSPCVVRQGVMSAEWKRNWTHGAVKEALKECSRDVAAFADGTVGPECVLPFVMSDGESYACGVMQAVPKDLLIYVTKTWTVFGSIEELPNDECQENSVRGTICKLAAMIRWARILGRESKEADAGRSEEVGPARDGTAENRSGMTLEELKKKVARGQQQWRDLCMWIPGVERGPWRFVKAHKCDSDRTVCELRRTSEDGAEEHVVLKRVQLGKNRAKAESIALDLVQRKLGEGIHQKLPGFPTSVVHWGDFSYIVATYVGVAAECLCWCEPDVALAMAKAIMEQCGDQLEELHSHELVFGDLHPRNITVMEGSSGTSSCSTYIAALVDFEAVVVAGRVPMRLARFRYQPLRVAEPRVDEQARVDEHKAEDWECLLYSIYGLLNANFRKMDGRAVLEHKKALRTKALNGTELLTRELVSAWLQDHGTKAANRT